MTYADDSNGIYNSQVHGWNIMEKHVGNNMLCNVWKLQKQFSNVLLICL